MKCQAKTYKDIKNWNKDVGRADDCLKDAKFSIEGIRLCNQHASFALLANLNQVEEITHMCCANVNTKSIKERHKKGKSFTGSKCSLSGVYEINGKFYCRHHAGQELLKGEEQCNA